MPKRKVAMLTAGGLAPCLSSALAELIQRYDALAPDIEMIGYLGGYRGLLLGESVAVTKTVREGAAVLNEHGGSPIGNSRVKLTNVADAVKRGLVKEGELPLKVAAEQLAKDGVTILHTIGGDDTSLTAADLAKYLADNGYDLTVVGLPKTIDNDIFPIRQSMGAMTAAEEGAKFFENVVNEATASARTLVIHEVMGRHSGWLTAATARAWNARLKTLDFLPGFNLLPERKAIDAIYVPELSVDIEAEGFRLKRLMERKSCVSVFVSEGANAQAIVDEMLSRGEEVKRDAFGHVKLDTINVGDWFSKRLTKLIGAERTLVQKSGYFARSAKANAEDRKLIRAMAHVAVDCALRGEAGLVGHDEERGDILRAIELPRVKGAKPFDVNQSWFSEMLEAISQPMGARLAVKHGGDD